MIDVTWRVFFWYQLYNIFQPYINQLMALITNQIKQRIMRTVTIRGANPQYVACVRMILANYPNVQRVRGSYPLPDDIQPGTYLIWYKSWPILLTVDRCVSVQSPDVGTPTMYMYGVATHPYVDEFYDSAQIATPPTLQASRISTSGTRPHVLSQEALTRRPFATVAIASNHLDAIKEAHRLYTNPPPIYKRLSIPNTLTILLSGPPGVGKSSIIRAIADMANLSIAECSLGLLTDESIACLHTATNNSIIVLEDIDCMQTRDPATKQVSLSGLLNFLQGSTTRPQFVIMTSNHPEKLDPALIRAERVNLHIRIEATSDLCAQMFEIYYEMPAPLAFIQDCERLKLTTASLQSFLRQHITPEPLLKALTSIESVPAYVKAPKQSASTIDDNDDDSWTTPPFTHRFPH